MTRRAPAWAKRNKRRDIAIVYLRKFHRTPSESDPNGCRP